MTNTTGRPAVPQETLANMTYDASRAHLSAPSGGGGGLATGPRDTVTGQIEEAPAEPLERPGTERAEQAEDSGGAIDAPRLTPQGRTGEDASEEDGTDPMGGAKTGQVDRAEG